MVCGIRRRTGAAPDGGRITAIRGILSHQQPPLLNLGVTRKDLMDWLWQLLIGWWWYGRDGRTKTADATDRYVLPVLLLILAGCLVAVAVWATQ